MDGYLKSHGAFGFAILLWLTQNLKIPYLQDPSKRLVHYLSPPWIFEEASIEA